MEAQNRWRLLESQTPAHNLIARNIKMRMTVDKSQPAVFYSHEGKYQRERAGMYKTSYDPYKLQYDMNKQEETGGRLFDVSDYHHDALNRHYPLNGAMSDAMRFGRTLGGPPGSVPQLHDQPTPYEVIAPYKMLRDAQKAMLQPQVEPTDVKTVEGGVILKETTYGDGYNTEKFQQQYQVQQVARKEPLALMSHENQSLENVRPAAIPKITQEMFENTTQALRLCSAPTGVSRHEASLTLRPETSPSVRPGLAETGVRNSLHLTPTSNWSGRGQYASRLTDVSTGGLRHSWAGEPGYNSQFKTGQLDLAYKKDPRFGWEPGSGIPRPQTKLLNIQDSFSKSEARKKFHQQFPETNPDLRENIVAGKKHTFGGLNAQILRGAAVTE